MTQNEDEYTGFKVPMSESLAGKKLLASALIKFQSKLNAVVHDKKNKYLVEQSKGAGGTYASLTQILAATRDLLFECKLCVTQRTDLMGDMFILITEVCHESGECISGFYIIEPLKKGPQELGLTLSYARRQAFKAMLGISTSDDENKMAKPKVPEAPTIGPHPGDFIAPQFKNWNHGGKKIREIPRTKLREYTKFLCDNPEMARAYADFIKNSIKFLKLK